MKVNVRGIRASMGETQKEFADHVGIKLSSYCQKERGDTQFTWKEILNICKYANVNPNDIE